MIRILHIVPTLGFGGVAKCVLNYYSYMDKNKFCFDFINHGSHEVFHDELVANGSNIYYFKTIGQVGIGKYNAQLKEVLRNTEYDAIHIHEGHLTGVTAFLCKRLGAAKTICHAHTTQCANPKHSLFMPIFRFLARKYGDVLLACGEEAGKYCFGEKKFTVIRNAIDLRHFLESNEQRVGQLKQQYGIHKGTFVVGHIGAFICQKNHVYILKVFSALLKQKSNAKLILVGDGILKKKIECLARNLGIFEKIVFAGIQSDIPAHLDLFNVFILPSFFEGLPVVSAEAQSKGLHCVFSDRIDCEADIGLGLIDFLPINEKTIGAWVDKILVVYKRPSNSEIIKQFEKTGYSLNNAVIQLEHIYTESIN